MTQTLDVLRHGWRDATSTLAPGVPELAEWLAARLETAAARGETDEAHLIAVVDEASGLCAGAGASAPQLVKRLRRTVYEYLLALDAVTPQERDPESHAPLWLPPPAPSSVVSMGGAETAAAIRSPMPEPAAMVGADEVDQQAVLEAVAGELEGEEMTHSVGEAVGMDAPEADDPVWELAITAASPLDTAAEAEPAGLTEVEPAAEVTARHEAELERTESFLAPRAGFHIIDEFTPARVPVFGEEGSQAADDGAPHFSPPPQPSLPAAPVAEPEPAPRSFSEMAVLGDEAEAAVGWRVRSQHRRGAEADTVTSVAEEEDPFFFDPRFTDMRRRIDDRLRRKRCDEAAALLQELAQEHGSRAVSELALDAGDRCRGLGKTNAALSCYLAASRADPAHEAPLSRLADVCIDDQDIDLAVSYLERVAQLNRLRHDLRGAMRVYRRIVTIAPYRQDVLAMLMRVQSTGEFDA